MIIKTVVAIIHPRVCNKDAHQVINMLLAVLMLGWGL